MLDLKLIKKYYGEDMMHYCRDNFPTLLEENKLYKLLSDNFYKNKFLYKDLETQGVLNDFKKYLLSRVDISISSEIKTSKDPFELMDEAGYTLYECKNEEDIQRFKKYYSKGEELCTFKDNRLETCYVFFAVKKNVDDIKRTDYNEPKRQDEYGTSVISIQFTKSDNNYVSIKNRYNHTVSNPDSTFNNNLDNIIPGLKYSFINKYRFNISRDYDEDDFELMGYVQTRDEKFYKYNYEIDNIYYCPDNIIIDNFNAIDKYTGDNSARYIVLDYFILDLKEKRMFVINENKIDDPFYKLYRSAITNVEIEKHDNKKLLVITTKAGISFITIDEKNRIIKYVNNYVKNVKDHFLYYSLYMKELEMNRVETIGEGFLKNNINSLVSVSLKNVKIIESNFLWRNKGLTSIYFPALIEVKDGFLTSNTLINNIYLPKLEKVENFFLYSNKGLRKIILPNIKYIGTHFVSLNTCIQELYMPNAIFISTGFLNSNRDKSSLRKLDLPSVITIDADFMPNNKSIKEVYLPNVISIKRNFLQSNTICKSIYAPELKEVTHSFMESNKSIKNLELDSLESVGNFFMMNNYNLVRASFKNLKIVREYFLANCYNLKEFYAPNLEKSDIKIKVKRGV